MNIKKSKTKDQFFLIDDFFENSNPFYKKPGEVDWDEFDKLFAEKINKTPKEKVPLKWFINCPECKTKFKFRKEKRCPDCGVTLYLFCASKESFSEPSGWVRRKGKFVRVENFLSNRKEKVLNKKQIKNIKKTISSISTAGVVKRMRGKNIVEIKVSGNFYNPAIALAKLVESSTKHELMSGKVKKLEQMSDEEKVLLNKQAEKTNLLSIEAKIAYVSQHCSGSHIMKYKKKFKNIVEDLARFYSARKYLTSNQKMLLDNIFKKTKTFVNLKKSRILNETNNTSNAECCRDSAQVIETSAKGRRQEDERV